MAQTAPDSVDVTDLQFKLQSKAKLFNSHDDANLNCHNLLAAASTHGLIFCGSTSSADLRVVQLSTLTSEDAKNGSPVPTRVFQLPGKPLQIAVNCDHSLLAVDVTKNGNCFLQIYSVPSFYANDVTLTHEFPIHGACHSSQLLWNPVASDVLAVVTENGGLVMYTLKSPGNEMCSLDGQQSVQSACWSPKGKQIVAGFPNGNLIQFKPDLKPARQIPCPPNLLGGPAFDTIAIQWLATYQFAAVFQSKAEDTTPALFIVNAPKTGNAVYINYDDICYSQSGPRKSQVFLSHILPWNLLIVASANSMEVGLLGTTEQGDFPTWKQFVPSDNARAELPLTAKKQETFPLGLALEVGVTHQITIGEQTFPVMPMIHLLSTDGLLISFNLLNTMPNAVGICCPPNPIRNNSGLGHFKILDLTGPTSVIIKQATPPAATNKADMTFSLGQGNATSTPAPVKSLFGNTSNNSSEPSKAATNLFGSLPAAKPPTFGAPATSTGFGFGSFSAPTAEKPPAFGTQPSKPPSFGFGNAPAAVSTNEQRPSAPTFGQSLASPAPSESNKPLITVPPTYTAATKPPSQPGTQTNKPQTQISGKAGSSDTEDAKIVQGMIREEILNFQKDLKELISRSKSINIEIGTKEESISMAKQLNELSKLNKEATEVNDSLSSDVHSLRVNLNETFAMVTEAKNKQKLYQTQNHLENRNAYTMSQTSKRQLARLESMLKMSESQLFMITRQIDAQWAEYQDMQKQRNRQTMKVPSLEGVYQTISKQRDILSRHRMTINALKHRLGMRDTVKALEITSQDPVESLTDSILSMSIIDQVQRENERLTPRKLELLKECLKRHKVQIITPKRPDRQDINSEVVQVKRENMRKTLAKAEKKVEPVKSAVKAPEPAKSVPQAKFELPKPVIPTQKPPSFASPAVSSNVSMSKPIAEKPVTTPTVAASTGGFAFGGNSFASNTSQPVKTETPKFSFAQLTPQAPQATFGTTATNSPFATSAQKGETEKPASPKPAFGDLTAKTQPSSAFSFGGLSTSKPSETKTESPLLFGTTTITPVVKPVEEKPKEETSVSFSLSKTPSGGLFGSSTASTSPIAPTRTTSLFGFGQKSTEEKKEEKEAPKSPLASLVETVNQFGAPSSGSSSVTITTKPAEKPSIFSMSKENTPEKEKTQEIIKPTAKFSFGFGAGSSSGQSDANNGNSSTVQNTETTPKAASEASTASAGSTKSPEFNFSSAAKGLENKMPFGGATIETKPASSGLNLSFGGSASSGNVTSTTETATPATKPSIFGSITPLGAQNQTKPAGGLFGSSGTGLFGSSSTVAATTASSGGIFGTSSASGTTTVSSGGPFGTTTPLTTTASSGIFGSAATTTTTASTGIFGTASVTATAPKTGIFGSIASPAAATTSPVSPPAVTTASSTAPTEGLFSSFNICSPSSPSNNASQSASSIFGASTGFGNASQSTSSIFGGGSAATDIKTSSIFGSSTTSSPFGASIPKPEQSVFGGASSGTSIFGQSATPAAASPFGQSQTSSIFGGGSTATTAANSPFGGSASSTTTNSPFGANTATPATNSPFGGGGGSLFGAANSSQTQSSPFGQQSSTFSQGGSLFGGSSTFGSGAGTTGSTGFGAFGASAQTQQPVFGGGATFGSPPAFGGGAFSKPAFGGAPTFGSKPLFGSPTQPTAQASVPTNNLFEQLGSQGSGPTFGNLAQASPPQPQQAPQSSFGGSAFSSWR